MLASPWQCSHWWRLAAILQTQYAVFSISERLKQFHSSCANKDTLKDDLHSFDMPTIEEAELIRRFFPDYIMRVPHYPKIKKGNTISHELSSISENDLDKISSMDTDDCEFLETSLSDYEEDAWLDLSDIAYEATGMKDSMTQTDSKLSNLKIRKTFASKLTAQSTTASTCRSQKSNIVKTKLPVRIVAKQTTDPSSIQASDVKKPNRIKSSFHINKSSNRVSRLCNAN